jgi:GntR family transcriptional regulator, transcriptional repressor for pyruvate dehydrogenase complex
VTRAKPVTDSRLRRELEQAASMRDGTGPRVAEDIAAQIQGLIISGDLPAGARLPSERDLAAMLSTSRPTVSQAIRILVVRGLVESRRGSGAYVTGRPEAELATAVSLMLDLNQESVQYLSELRLQLETTGIEWAIERATADQVDAGMAALEQMRHNAGYAAAWMSADTQFHSALVQASHNPYLASMYESVHRALIDYEYQAWVDKGTAPVWLGKTQAAAQLALHEPILEAVRRRDVGLARQAVLRHHDAMAQHLQTVTGNRRGAREAAERET